MAHKTQTHQKIIRFHPKGNLLKTTKSKRHDNCNGFKKNRSRNKSSRAATSHGFFELGRFGVPFWRPLDFEGAPSKTISKNSYQNEMRKMRSKKGGPKTNDSLLEF